MGMFDEPGTRGPGGLAPQNAGKVSAEVIKQVAVGARALFSALPMIRIVPLGAILIVAAIFGKGIVETVANGTYQIRQMVVTDTMKAKMEPGMWLRLFSDIETWPKAQTFFFTKDAEGGECADNRIQGPINQCALLKQGQPATAHFMGQFNPGFLNHFQPHPVHKDKAICFINDGGQLAAEVCTIDQSKLDPVTNLDTVNLGNIFRDCSVFQFLLALNGRLVNGRDFLFRRLFRRIL